MGFLHGDKMKRRKRKETIEEFKYRINRYNFLHKLIQDENKIDEDKEESLI